MSRYLILDVATAPLSDAADYVSTEDLKAPTNYKDPEKIAQYLAQTKQDRLEKAALDLDLCRISGVGFMRVDTFDTVVQPEVGVTLARDVDEAELLRQLAPMVANSILVGFNSRVFDWRVLQRRAVYLGVKFPKISVDRYRTLCIDLFDKLSDNGAGTAHSLQFYVRRFGWTDLQKPLSGAEESRVFETGAWDELEQALWHDVVGTYRLARALQVW